MRTWPRACPSHLEASLYSCNCFSPVVVTSCEKAEPIRRPPDPFQKVAVGDACGDGAVRELLLEVIHRQWGKVCLQLIHCAGSNSLEHIMSCGRQGHHRLLALGCNFLKCSLSPSTLGYAISGASLTRYMTPQVSHLGQEAWGERPFRR